MCVKGGDALVGNRCCCCHTDGGCWGHEGCRGGWPACVGGPVGSLSGFRLQVLLSSAPGVVRCLTPCRLCAPVPPAVPFHTVLLEQEVHRSEVRRCDPPRQL